MIVGIRNGLRSVFVENRNWLKVETRVSPQWSCLEITTNSQEMATACSGETGRVWLLEDRGSLTLQAGRCHTLMTHSGLIMTPPSRWRTDVPPLQELVFCCVVAKIQTEDTQLRSWTLTLRFIHFRASWEQGPPDIRWLWLWLWFCFPPGLSPKPSIWAVPSTMIPCGSSVTFPAVSHQGWQHCVYIMHNSKEVGMIVIHREPRRWLSSP
jgi:hypothetical protein